MSFRDYEVEEIEEILAGGKSNEKPCWMWPEIDKFKRNSYSNLVIGLPGAGATLLGTLLEKEKIVGAIFDPNLEMSSDPLTYDNTSIQLFQNTDPRLLMCVVEQSLHLNSATRWVSLLFSKFSFERVIVLDDIGILELNSSKHETLLKVEVGETRQDGVPYLDSFVFVKGTAAAILSYLEAHNIPGTLYLSVNDALDKFKHTPKSAVEAFKKIRDFPVPAKAIKSMGSFEAVSSLYT